MPDAPARAPSGRRAVITREDLITAALSLLGPHRSVSTLSLREVAREAGIAPNSFYRHFRDMDELAVALIEEAGATLRKIIGSARKRATNGTNVIRGSIEVFMEQLAADQKFLHILMREGTAGSDAFNQAVESQLISFEEELYHDLVALSKLRNETVFEPELAAKAITRLIFSVGGSSMDLPPEKLKDAAEQMIVMVRMIVVGSRTMAVPPNAADDG